MSRFLIIGKPGRNPEQDVFYILKPNNAENVTLIGDVAIAGSVVSLAKTYDEASTTVRNLEKIPAY